MHQLTTSSGGRFTPLPWVPAVFFDLDVSLQTQTREISVHLSRYNHFSQVSDKQRSDWRGTVREHDSWLHTALLLQRCLPAAPSPGCYWCQQCYSIDMTSWENSGVEVWSLHQCKIETGMAMTHAFVSVSGEGWKVFRVSRQVETVSVAHGCSLRLMQNSFSGCLEQSVGCQTRLCGYLCTGGF